MAESFGAKCYTKIVPQLTHLIANKDGTEKVVKIAERNANHTPFTHILTLDWLMDSISSWEKKDELDYYLNTNYKVKAAKQKHVTIAKQKIEEPEEDDADSILFKYSEDVLLDRSDISEWQREIDLECSDQEDSVIESENETRKRRIGETR